MGSKSDYLEAKILDHVLGATAYTAPATVYFALFTVTPTDAGGGTEATGSGYARKAVTNNTTNFPNATGTNPTTKTNGTQIDFATATGDWSTGANMVAWGIFDAVSAGNLLYWGALTIAKPVLNGDTASIPASSLTITED